MAPRTHTTPGMASPAVQAREVDRLRKSTPAGIEANRFYAGRRWRRLRRMVLASAPLCEQCKRAVASEVHHIVDRAVQPDLAYDVGNLLALCPACHNRARTDA